MNKLWKNICLDGTWELYIAENRKVKNLPNPAKKAQLKGDIFTRIDGTVPGNFELDMERAGMYKELFFGTNVLELQKLENRHLWYVRTFEWNGKNADRMYFDFEGIDTISEIYLNGKKIAETDNMYIAHEVKAEGIKKGKNELMVHIKPVVLEARNREMEAYAGGMEYNCESLTIRKAPHMYGWDIFPRIVSGGIWRSVYLYERPADYIDELYFYTLKLAENSATLQAHFKVHAESSDYNRDYTLCIKGTCGDSTFERKLRLWHVEGLIEELRVENPKLWWSRDLGDPSLYDITAELYLGDELIDTYKTRMGIRTIKLESTLKTDKDGSGEFKFIINGEPVFIRGTNWVPLDPFHSRDKERMPMATKALWDIGCNGVRCWGGNVYEDHDFYDFCDEHGILVWQDFSMGCAVYPQTEQLCEALRMEAISVVKKLRQHPSLALWAGDNECDTAIASPWKLPPRNPANNVLTRKVLPDVIRRHDISRQFLPSSPYFGDNIGDFSMLSEQHAWVRYNYKDFYANNVAHFASETGAYCCPSPESVKKFISSDKLFPWKGNDEWMVHSSQPTLSKELGGDAPSYEPMKYEPRLGFIEKTTLAYFDFIPDNLYDYALSSQINSAEADKFFVEHFRLKKWRKSGIMIWNLMDGWPQFSEATVDYYGSRKLNFYFLRNVQRPVCLMFDEPQNGEQAFVGANDTLKEQTVSYKVREIISGATVLEGDAVIPANSLAEIAKLPEATDAVKFYAIEWTVNGETCRNHFVTGKPPYDFKQYVEWLKEADVLELEGF